MTQENKELLLKDLSARLLYGVKVQINSDVKKVVGVKNGFVVTKERGLYSTKEYITRIECCRPYLRSISSMTEEEKLHVELTYGFFYHDGVLDNVHIFEGGGIYDRDGNYYPPCEYRQERHVTIQQVLDFIHWLNAHHFDYHGLIEKGLAIAVDENNNPYN